MKSINTVLVVVITPFFVLGSFLYVGIWICAEKIAKTIHMDAWNGNNCIEKFLDKKISNSYFRRN